MRFALAKSPDIQFVPETALLYKYWGGRTLRRVFGARFVARVLARSMVTGYGDPTMKEFIDREAAIAAQALARPTLDACAHVLEAFYDRPVRYIGEKSPNNTIHVRDVLRWSGRDARAVLIYMERDPHDQIASSVRTSHISGGLIYALARRHVYTEAIKGLELIRVAYEDLVLQPEPTLRRVCEALGVDYRPEMLKPGVLDSSDAEHFFQQGDFGFIPDSIGKGRGKLGEASAAKVDRFLASGPASLGLRERIQFWLLVAALRRNQWAARAGLVMSKTMARARVMGLDAAGRTEEGRQ